MITCQCSELHRSPHGLYSYLTCVGEAEANDKQSKASTGTLVFFSSTDSSLQLQFETYFDLQRRFPHEFTGMNRLKYAVDELYLNLLKTLLPVKTGT